jgi:formate hydrogenlyase subunit 4
VILALSILAQMVHVVLMLAAVPVLDCAMRWLGAWVAGRPGPPLLSGWWDTVRLFRKQVVVSESQSPFTDAAPAICLALTATCAVLVPSFTLGMVLAPCADLLAIAGLLMAGRVVLLLAALDSGQAWGGLAASRTMRLAVVADPVLLVAVLALALAAGGTNLDMIAGVLHEDLTSAGAVLVAVLIIGMALGVLALVDTAGMPASMDRIFSGGPLAATKLAEVLRLLVWFDLLGALLLPIGMARIEAGLLDWPLGLLAWGGKTLGLAVCVTGLRAVGGRLLQARAIPALGLALACGVLAVAMVLAGIAAA